MRTRKEIDNEYSQIAALYGDRVARGALIQKEISILHEKMLKFLNEKAIDDPQTPEQIEEISEVKEGEIVL